MEGGIEAINTVMKAIFDSIKYILTIIWSVIQYIYPLFMKFIKSK